MKIITNEFSFILKPSTIEGAGVGVFATHDIKKGTLLRLYGEEKNRVLKKNEVPKEFVRYAHDMGDKLLCPQDFGWMPLGWYLNHSKNANLEEKEDGSYAIKDIKVGEEIFIDYNTLGEPEESKSEFYKN